MKTAWCSPPSLFQAFATLSFFSATTNGAQWGGFFNDDFADGRGKFP